MASEPYPAPQGVVDLIGEKAGLKGAADDLVQPGHPHDPARVPGLDQQETEAAAVLGLRSVPLQLLRLSLGGEKGLRLDGIKGGESRPVAAVKRGCHRSQSRIGSQESQPGGAE